MDLKSYLQKRFEQASTEIRGQLLTSPDASVWVYLRTQGVMELRGLSHPLPPYMKFEGDGSVHGAKEPQGWSALSDDLVEVGVHLFRLYDPRVYAKGLELGLMYEVASEGDWPSAQITIAYKLIDVAEPVLQMPLIARDATLHLAGSGYQSEFLVKEGELDVHVEDFVPSLGPARVSFSLK